MRLHAPLLFLPSLRSLLPVPVFIPLLLLFVVRNLGKCSKRLLMGIFDFDLLQCLLTLHIFYPAHNRSCHLQPTSCKMQDHRLAAHAVRDRWVMTYRNLFHFAVLLGSWPSVSRSVEPASRVAVSSFNTVCNSTISCIWVLLSTAKMARKTHESTEFFNQLVVFALFRNHIFRRASGPPRPAQHSERARHHGVLTAGILDLWSFRLWLYPSSCNC